jgi:hypothetical protein
MKSYYKTTKNENMLRTKVQNWESREKKKKNERGDCLHNWHHNMAEPYLGSPCRPIVTTVVETLGIFGLSKWKRGKNVKKFFFGKTKNLF